MKISKRKIVFIPLIVLQKFIKNIIEIVNLHLKKKGESNQAGLQKLKLLGNFGGKSIIPVYIQF